MSVIIRIIGENDQSDEFLAAERLKKIIEETVPNKVFGEIILFPSATLYGQTVKDIDLMMIGHLKNYSVKTSFYHKDSFEEDKVFIESFCTTIEVKSHTASGIMREGTNWKVKYNNGWHNVTKQSNDQRIAAKKFFENSLGKTPFITNLIWFTEITDTELRNLQTVNGSNILSNVLPDNFDFSYIAKLLVLQRIPWMKNGNYFFECGFGGNDVEAYRKPLAFFSKAKEGMGDLTRKKIEQITQSVLDEYLPSFQDGKMSIIRGRAGSGKTIDLIRIAVKLVEEKGVRVQILTYNRALVSDIRRLFALAELPDMFEEKCVAINTMQSYFYNLINSCLYNGNLTGDVFLKNYQSLLTELLDFLRSGVEAQQIIKEICNDNTKLHWDYVFIDEAQDWQSVERDLILLLYNAAHIFIADGGNQFVRMSESCDWTIVDSRENIKLKYCLRQKRNIVKFINQFVSLYNVNYSKIISSEKMAGGKIIIICDDSQLYRVLRNEHKNIQKAGNIPYDMLYLVPNTLVTHDEEASFCLIQEFEENGIFLWDGTNQKYRLDYAIDPNEARVFQYESSRGLEGWTVCCIHFDEYLKIKEQQYEPSIGANALFLESAEERKNKYLLNWAMIPMTRAIDTLIITLKNKDSKVAQQILSLAKKNLDYVEII